MLPWAVSSPLLFGNRHGNVAVPAWNGNQHEFAGGIALLWARRYCMTHTRIDVPESLHHARADDCDGSDLCIEFKCDKSLNDPG